MLALWPRQCQDEVWGDDPSVLIASALMFPPGKATRAPGGYRLTGRWPFSSGVDASAWNMLGGIIQGGEVGEMRMFVVPREDYRIIDTWRALGLRGTGSNDVESKDIFVPIARSPSMRAKVAPRTRARRQSGPLFRIPLVAALPTC
jgi:3-hydroxy-9,10-secoandrosta-1,3,5(10)-triene-9,17-dione monooxygenase